MIPSAALVKVGLSHAFFEKLNFNRYSAKTKKVKIKILALKKRKRQQKQCLTQFAEFLNQWLTVAK